MRQGFTVFQSIGAKLSLSVFLCELAWAQGRAGQLDEGLALLAEAQMIIDKTGERLYEVELYRMKGELTLQKANQKSKDKSRKSKILNPQSQILDLHSEAEVCFHKAIKVARRQQAKSLELRAATSLARLWQQQGKRAEAHCMLSEIYQWFTEGFETTDLQEAKALLNELQ